MNALIDTEDKRKLYYGIYKCPKCGKELSDKVGASQSCGRPVSKQLSKNKDKEIANN